MTQQREKDLLYKIWLNAALGQDAYKVDRAIRLFDSAEEIHKLGKFDKNRIKLIGVGTKFFKLLDKSLDNAKRTLEQCDRLGIRIITMDDNEYPNRLRQIAGHPAILYVKGELADIDNAVGITIVGARECSDYGAEMAYGIAYNLAKCGTLIVSGMAEGIDAAAHEGALRAGKPTIAVLGGGVERPYPPKNTNLYNVIKENGTLISEYVPGTPPRGVHFPVRNRILAALSMGTVVVEAKYRSGVRHTVRYAQEFGKDVFAVVGNANSELSEYPNSLIKDGAKPVTGALDILNEYIGVYPDMLNNMIKVNNPVIYRGRSKKVKAEKPVDSAKNKKHSLKIDIDKNEKYTKLPEIQKQIVKLLLYNHATHIDNIIRGVSSETAQVRSHLTMLEMAGIVEQNAGQNFKLSEKFLA